MSILLAAMMSAILIASRALPDPDRPRARTAQAGRVIDQMAAELAYAITVTKASATAIEFTVDRHGIPATIRYKWSGTPGDPLTRKYNSGSKVTVLEDVREFDLQYYAVSNEIELSSHVTISTGTSFTLSSIDWIGQYFTPANLPPNALSWKVTRVLFKAQRRDPGSVTTLVQLRTSTTGNLPSPTVLEQRRYDEEDLSTDQSLWRQFEFTNVSGLAPGEGLCLVLQWAGDDHNVRFDNTGGSGRLVTGDSGSSWTNESNTSMNYYVYGTVVTPGVTAPPYLVRGVGIVLRSGSDPGSRISTAVAVLNEPWVDQP